MDDFSREEARAMLLLNRLEGILPNNWEFMDTMDDVFYNYSDRDREHDITLEVFYDHMNPISYRFRVDDDDYFDTLDEAFSRYDNRH